MPSSDRRPCTVTPDSREGRGAGRQSWTCDARSVHPTAGPLSGRNSAGSSRFPKSAARIIATSAGRRSPAPPTLTNCVPGLRGRCAALRDEPGDGALGHVEAELQQLTMDSRRAPEGIGRGHSCDKGRDLRVDRWAASGGPTGEFGPVLTETAPLPPQNGVASNDHKRLSPPGPDPGQRHPEEPIFRA
jgi:hypothetical protein